jgi:hypothetical protein
MTAKNRILQVAVTDENAIALVNLVNAKLALKQYSDRGFINLDFIKDEISVEDIEYCIDNNIELERVPFYLELTPSKKDNITPSMFPNRSIATAWDEDGNPTATRNRKIGEYFRYHEKGGRFFIELVKDPKNDTNVALGTVSVVDYLSATQIKEVYDTFTTAIISKYASMKAMLAELASIEEIE